MRVAYRPLFQIRPVHTFFSESATSEAFTFEPTPTTQRLLEDLGLLFRSEPAGGSLFGEIVPLSDPATLLRPFGSDSLRFQFLLRPLDTTLLNISDLPDYRPGREVLYFSNLRNDQENGRLYLSDSVANARVGDPVRLVTRTTWTHDLGAPADSVTVTITNQFGSQVASADFSFEGPVDQLRIGPELSEDLGPGFYEVSDDLGGSENLFYDPQISGRDAVGIVEVFINTSQLTPDQSDQVPGPYRFLNGDEVIPIGPYHVEFEARTTTWRYIVIKKYESNDIALADLQVSADFAFSKDTQSDRAIFTSTTTVQLAKTAQAVTLENNGESVMDLPSPSQATPLQEGAAPGQYVSEMYIYV